MVLICCASLKLHIREKPSGRARGRRGDDDEMWGWWGGLWWWKEGREEEKEEAAAVLELMSACQIRNTMHLRQRITEIGREWRNREGNKKTER